jgi:hypothetical protein
MIWLVVLPLPMSLVVKAQQTIRQFMEAQESATTGQGLHQASVTSSAVDYGNMGAGYGTKFEYAAKACTQQFTHALTLLKS